MSERSATADRRPISLIFGGTFDPPHRGHLRLSFAAARELACEELVFIPTRVQSLKLDTPLTEVAMRMRMLDVALEAHRRGHGEELAARISPLELEQAGPSYTIDTLRALQAEYLAKARGEAPQLRLLIGSDQALEFTRWKDWREILDLAPPAVMPRPPHTSATLARAYQELFGDEFGAQWQDWTLDLPNDSVSSTEVRARIKAGQWPGELVAPEVLELIGELGLYGSRTA